MGRTGLSNKRYTMNPLLLLLFPLAEIAAFILVGNAIGLMATLALIVASSVIGLALLRDAGIMTAFKLRRGQGDAATILAEGGVGILAGVLLFVPGFLTDLMALAVLAAPVRRWALGRIVASSRGKSTGAPTAAPGGVIEGYFKRLKD